jgi:hypothetical protein
MKQQKTKPEKFIKEEERSKEDHNFKIFIGEKYSLLYPEEMISET